jgi:hypothetical protein
MDIIELKKKTNTVRHPWEYARFNVLKFFFKKIIDKNLNPVIIDIGCGDSFVVESISKIYPNAKIIGVDTAFTPEIVAEINERIKNKNILFYYSINEVPKSIKADCILLMDVIEHVENDIDFLQQVSNSSFVTNITKWFITVPAFQSLFCSHDVFLGHFRRYDNAMLIEHCVKGGLIKKRVGYFFFSLLLPRYLQVKKESKQKQKNLSTGIVDWNGGPFKTKLITFILTLDFKFTRLIGVLGIKMKGLSNYIICQKSA